MVSALIRFVHAHREVLARRIARELAPAFGEARAKDEAVRLLDGLTPALRRSDPAALADLVREATARWAAAGVTPEQRAAAVFALVLPRHLQGRWRAPADPWDELEHVLTPLVDSVPQPFLMVDRERRVRFANRAFLDWARLEPGDVIGSPATEMFSSESRDWAVRTFAAEERAIDDISLGRVRLRVRPEDELLASPMPCVTAGRVVGWYVTLRPDPDRAFTDPTVSEMVQREKRQKEKFAALLEVSNAVVNSLDLETILTTIAKQVREVIQTDECTVFLYDEADQLLKPVVCDVASYESEVMSVRLRLGEGITGTVALTGQGEIVNAAENDPRAVQVPGTPEDQSSLLCVPLLSRDQVLGVITLVRIGTRYFVDQDLELATLFAGQCSAAIQNARLFESTRKAYEELREAQTQLVQSAKLNALGEMAGGVAHDFNNILAAILGRTQLLLQSAREDEVRRQLVVIEQAALDGAQTVRRVQEFTRVRQDERFETLDVNRVLEDVVELTRPVWEGGAKRRGIAIELDLDLGARLTIVGNGSELREVFTNLVLNAVDAMPWGGLLAVTSTDEGAEVRVAIRDTGVGMDEDTRRRVFDPFFTTKQVKGTGLGLSVAYGIVTRHRGRIEVISEPSRGTEFLLRFPAGRSEELAEPAPVQGDLPRLRALVVDDEQAVLDVLTDLLRSMGQQVTPALGGAAGVQAFGRDRFDVVFSDLGMPELNGWDLAVSVKRQDPAIRVVLVTGWAHQLEGGAAQAHGVDIVMPKPFSIEDVESVLRTIAEGPGHRRVA